MQFSEFTRLSQQLAVTAIIIYLKLVFVQHTRLHPGHVHSLVDLNKKYKKIISSRKHD